MFDKKLVDRFRSLPTPFHFYDVDLLEQTLSEAGREAGKYGFLVHYALKANSNDRILQRVDRSGFGADCVSGNEIRKAIENGFSPEEIVFAGVGKADDEIRYSLEKDIFCFNCESVQELQVIAELAASMGKKANIALRVNPNVDANTHKYITTGLEENKFGIDPWELENALDELKAHDSLNLIGLHFHIGSQITDLTSFENLCIKVNEFQQWFIDRNILLEHINVGGGLGIDYHSPGEKAIPDFEKFFRLFHEHLDLQPGQQVHFELGRALVGHCGSLISKVLYLKKGIQVDFAILDAGMTELIRPALYNSFHTVQNLSGDLRQGDEQGVYDVVGPICESSDRFGKRVELPITRRGDLIAIRSTGAYGEVMSSEYNLREKAKAYYSDDM